MEVNNNTTSNLDFGSSTSSLPQPTLDSSDFFELLVTQLVNQDPLEPMKDTDFVAQMSTFTSLEQMKQLNEGFEQFQQDSLEISAQDYLGKDVSVLHQSGVLVDGLVSAVNSVLNPDGSNHIELTVDGKQYNISDVREVRLAKDEAS